MRRADLRLYDIRLIGWILGVFCTLSIMFFLFIYGNYIVPKLIPVKLYLWGSYSIIAVTVIVVYALTKQTRYEWVRLTGAAEMIGKGKYLLEKGTSYLVKDETKATDVIIDSLVYKVPCLYITRTNPDILRQKYKQLSDANVIWLSELDAKNTLNPTEVEEISYCIQRYLEKTGPSIILFDGLTYMLNALPFQRLLHLVQDIRDHTAVKDGVLLFPLDPTIIDLVKLNILERELAVM